MRKEIINEIKQMQKLMIYNLAKTDTENTKIFEQIIGTPPDGSSGGNTGGNTGGNNTGRRVSRTLLPIPSELGNAAGVKKFQDWVVANNFGGELGRFGADSKFGSFTKAAWDKHKTSYLNSTDPNFSDDLIDLDDIQGQPSGQADIDDIQGQVDVDDIQGQPAGQTTQQPAGQTSQQPAGQPAGDVADITVPKGAPVVPSQDELPN